jgi:hypothetical protein
MSANVMLRTTWTISLALAALGCGPTPPAETPAPPAVTAGDEAPPAQPALPSPSVETEPAVPPASGPATVTIEAKVNGKVVSAGVRILGPDGAEVAVGKSGDPIAVQSGEYTLAVDITDEAVLLDKPTQERSLTVNAGDSLQQRVDFPWAKIQLNVRINGNLDSSAEVLLGRKGAHVATLKSGAPAVPISPGRYEAEVHTKGSTTKVEGLMFPEGATQSVPVNLQL